MTARRLNALIHNGLRGHATSKPSAKIGEAQGERVLIPTSVTCRRCRARVDVAKSWDWVQCPCGETMRLHWDEMR